MDSAKPNDQMKKEALLGLSWRKEFGRGGTMVGVARARDIANGANLSLDTIKRMNSFFARHEVDKEAQGFRPGEKGYPSNGRIAWALWGGDAGKAWAASKLEMTQGVNMIFPEDEEFLAHYGKKGMKWGVRKSTKSLDAGKYNYSLRKGKSQTGMSRTRAGVVDVNKRYIEINKNLSSGSTAKRLAKSPFVYGIPQSKKMLAKKTAKLEAKNARIVSGNLKLGDKISIPLSVSLATAVKRQRVSL